jgi:hypothetical protein
MRDVTYFNVLFILENYTQTISKSSQNPQLLGIDMQLDIN